MTIDEAIKHGKEQLEVFGGEHKEFIKLAIKALEQSQELDRMKNKMMYDIYMKGVNMSGEYQGCWVRFKTIENIIKRYFS